MKPRTARAIEPNVGSRKALEKKLVKMYDDLFKRVFAAIVDDLTEAGMLSEETLEGGASDAALALTGAEKRVLSNVQKKLKAGISPNEIGTRVNKFSAERIARWLLGTDEEARKISHWFVNTAARDATAAQRKALLDAGVSPKALKERWSVPYLKKTFLAPETANALPSIADMVTSGLKGFSAENDCVRTSVRLFDPGRLERAFQNKPLGCSESEARGFAHHIASPFRSREKELRVAWGTRRNLDPCPGPIHVSLESHAHERQTVRARKRLVG